jgi:hypothetical protein
VLRMTALSATMKTAGVFERKLTFLP